MSTMISVRLDDALFEGVERERKRAGLTRARAVQEALALWIERRRTEQAARRDRAGYERRPVERQEFDVVLGAQRWPK